MSGTLDLKDSIGLFETNGVSNTVTVTAADAAAFNSTNLTNLGSGNYSVNTQVGSIIDDFWNGSYGAPQAGDPLSFTLTIADPTQNIITYTETLDGGGTTPPIGVEIIGVNSQGVIGEEINSYFNGAPPSYVQANLIPNSLLVFSTADLTLTQPGYSGPTAAELTFGQSVCFVEGTRIHTTRGEVAVEDLVEGDRVAVLFDGAAADRPVVWIGHRTVNLKDHRDPFLAQPIRVRRGAFGDAMPSRDLLVSPDHALFFDGVLVPARLLVNGASIVRETRLPKVRYFHVELDRHSIILANNLPTESYLDTDNRSFFLNAGQVVDLSPNISTISPSEMRETMSCAPFVHEPEEVRVIWEMLAGRAEIAGYGEPGPEATTDAALRLCVGGREYKPVCVAGEVHTFMLPSGRNDVRLVSRSARPCDARPWIDDQRMLGISVNRIRVRHGSEIVDVALDGPGFGSGWCEVEQADVQMWRWTTGDATLRLPEANGAGRLLELTISGGMSYPLDAVAEKFAATA
jgi:hypothetical protein